MAVVSNDEGCLNEYKFRAELSGHSKDVRCIATTDSGLIVSGSRDGTTRIWEEKSNGTFDEVKVIKGHKPGHFVSSVAFMPASSSCSALIFTGSNDRTIRAYNAASFQHQYTLEGHQANVCTLAVDNETGILVSGSWDSTARIWREKECVGILQGHNFAVWSVAVVPDPEKEETKSKNQLPRVLSASADKTIKLWNNCMEEKTFTGHADCVRAVLTFPGNSKHFLSASNDASIRKWDLLTGDCLQELHGHDNYIYSLSLLKNEGFVTSSEDRTLRIWTAKDGTLPDTTSYDTQILLMPAQSVWCSAVLPNGDVICGSSDGMIRIFTKSCDRVPSDAVLSTYDMEVAAFSETLESEGEIGGIKIADLPGKEALQQSGSREGQTKMVRVGDKVEVHSWSAAEGQWKKLGDAVGAKGPSPGKKMYMGQEYDYVFDVDVEEGTPPLKLPYNLSEDPWAAAQNFIWKNSLPQTYLDEVAQFIYRNAPNAGQGARSTGGDADPLTGGSRYVPGSGSAVGGGAGEASDPFTGESRYVPRGRTVQEVVFSDPLTGGGRYIPNGNVSAAQNVPADPKKPMSEHMPLKDYKMFENVSAESLLNKLKEFNNGEQLKESFRLKEVEFADLEKIVTCGKYVDLTSAQLKSLEKALQWPKDCLIPVLDVFRFGVLKKAGNKYFFGKETLGPQILPTLCGILAESFPSGFPLQILICRAIANGFSQEDGRTFLLTSESPNMAQVLELLTTCLGSVKAAVQIAAVGAVGNFALALLGSRSQTAEERRVEALKAVSDCLKKTLKGDFTDLAEEANFGLLQCFVTLMWGSSTVIAVGRWLKIGEIVAALKDAMPEENGKIIARAIDRMLFSAEERMDLD